MSSVVRDRETTEISKIARWKPLLTSMDRAFGDYYQEAEKLSLLLNAPQHPFSWTSYHALAKQRISETVAYEKYRGLREELFAFVVPPDAGEARGQSEHTF